MTEQSGGDPRYVVTSVGIALRLDEDGESPRADLHPLEHAPEHAEQVASALAKFGYRPDPVENGQPGGLGHELRVGRALTRESTEVLIVHIVGHGELAEGSSERLYVLDENGRRFEDPVSAWIGRIEDHPERPWPQTLFILDVCYAGEPAVAAWHARMDVTRRRAWVLAATLPSDRAYNYRLSRALVRVLTKYRSREHRFDPSIRHIPATTVYQDLERTMHELIAEDGGYPQTLVSSLVPMHADLSHLSFFPNPSFGSFGRDGSVEELPPEIARLTDWAWDPDHFMRRGGGAEPVGRDWRQGYFSGREVELRSLAAWLDDERAGPGLRLVTGAPGAGKSALLGVLVCAAHPVLRRHTERLWQSLRDQAPGEAERLVVVHVRRLGLHQIVDSLARQLRDLRASWAAPGDEAATEESDNPTDRLLRLVPQDGRPVTLVIDALDEADHPADIVTALLLPLARHALEPERRLRLLIGTRRDQHIAPLFESAGTQGEAVTDLDATPPEVLGGGVRRYVEQLLAAEGPYTRGFRRDAREALARSIAEELTGPRRQVHDWGVYLTAGLYVHVLLADDTACDTREAAAELGRRVPQTLPELLALDLTRNRHQPLLLPVLAALAHAHGRGMPELLLAQAATVFAPPVAVGQGSLPLEELYGLLDGEARFYLRRDVDTDGTTLYRLFHEGLVDWLRNDPGTLADHTVGTAVPRQLQEALYEELLTAVPRAPLGGRLWHLASPYLLRHAAQHAADAGRLDELLDDTEFLVHADPQVLAGVLRRRSGTNQGALLSAAVYRASWGVHHDLAPGARRHILSVDAARFQHVRMREQLHGDTRWLVRWATGRQVSTALVDTLSGHGGGVTGVVVGDLHDRPHAVTIGYDLTIRVWDLTTGSATFTRPFPKDSFDGATIVVLHNRLHVVTEETVHKPMLERWETPAHDGEMGDIETGVRVWDLTTGATTHHLGFESFPYKDFQSEMRVRLVTTGRRHDRPYVITRSRGSDTTWDLTTGARTTHDSTDRAAAHLEDRLHGVAPRMDSGVTARDFVMGHTARVTGVATTALHGRPHAVSASLDGTVRVWDLTSDATVNNRTGHTATVTGAAITTLHGRPHALTSSEDGTVIVWDLATGATTYTYTGHAGAVTGVAVTELHGRPHALTTASDGTGAVWDLTSGVTVNDLTDHTSWVTGAALTNLHSRPHALTAGIDGAVAVWDLTSGTATHQLQGHTGAVTGVAATNLHGRPHALTSSEDGTVVVWDLVAGAIAQTFTGHTGGVTELAVADLGGLPHALTTGRDRTVEVRDLVTGVTTAVLHLPDVAGAVAAGPDGAVVLGLGRDVVALNVNPATRSES